MDFFIALSLVAMILRGLQATTMVVDTPPTFEVDYNNSQFLKDGVPFRYVAGEMHYFRIPSAYWKDRLHKLKAVGANTVQTYIEWSQHEPSPNTFRFDGQYDVAEFIKLAQAEGLNVILRPGPYICAEREFGGYPAWLLSINPNIKLRTSDPSHTYFVERWFQSLMPQIVPLLYGNGGPVIMVQVENEYGSYPDNDQKYLSWLRDLYKSYIKDAAVLFTTDGADQTLVKRGYIPGVLATVDFGPSTDSVSKKFNTLKQVQPKGPLVNSEYYVGWLSYWGQPFSTVDEKSVVYSISDMLQSGVSFSMYMFHGGTNFGFSAGSGSDEYFRPDLTSYDYDAPLSEAGDPTDKYYAIQDVLSEHFEIEEGIKASEKGRYGPFSLDFVTGLFESPVSKDVVRSDYPLSFEQLDQRFGFVSYETEVLTYSMDPSVLQVTLRDRGIVYLEDVELGVLMYTVINEMPIPSWMRPGQTLRILVENMGRRNYGRLSDCTKGLVTNATLDKHVLKDWNITGYPLRGEDVTLLENISPSSPTGRPPAFYRATFQLPEGQPLDTFLDTRGYGKGVAFLNGFNLGRYWELGPQATLYVPGYYFKPYPQYNVLLILELHRELDSKPAMAIFTTKPILNTTHI